MARGWQGFFFGGGRCLSLSLSRARISTSAYTQSQSLITHAMRNDVALCTTTPPFQPLPPPPPPPLPPRPTPKYFLNFSNVKTQQWWLNSYVAPALDDVNIDGVYTDCSCGTARGYRVTKEELVGRQAAFDAALALAKAKGKWMSAWVGPAVVGQGFGAAGARCAASMDSYIALGQDSTHGMQFEGGWAGSSGRCVLHVSTQQHVSTSARQHVSTSARQHGYTLARTAANPEPNAVRTSRRDWQDTPCPSHVHTYPRVLWL